VSEEESETREAARAVRGGRTCSCCTTLDARSTQPGLVSACVTYTLKGLKVTKTRWSRTMAAEPYFWQILGLGALRSMASLKRQVAGGNQTTHQIFV